MTLVINAGSGAIPAAGNGWTNTYERAEQQARQWHETITDEDGIRDVELVLPGEDLGDGRWRFRFRHTVTGATVHLDAPGVDNYQAYERERTFSPRTYWNGSSTGEPSIEDWVAEGFEVVQTFRPVAVPAGPEGETTT